MYLIEIENLVLATWKAITGLKSWEPQVNGEQSSLVSVVSCA